MGVAISIEALDEGFIVETDDERRCAISTPDLLIRKIGKVFGFSEETYTPHIAAGDGLVLKQTVGEESKMVSVSKPSDEMDKSTAGNPGAGTDVQSPDHEALLEKPLPEVLAIEKGTVTPVKTEEFKEEIVKRIEPDSDKQFVFKECSPFDYAHLPSYRVGKSIYQLSEGCVRISRDGSYSGLVDYVTLADLKYLFEHPDEQKDILARWKVYPNKVTILRAFLREVVSFDQIGLIKYIQPKPEPESDNVGGVEPVSNPAPKLNRWEGSNGLRKEDILIPKFEFDIDRRKNYKNIFFVELPDSDRVVIEYRDAKYYTTKSLIMRIPYPFPRGYFDTERGWNVSVEQAVKRYREYLFEEEKREKERLEREDPDRPFKPMLNTNTRTDREEEKIEGSLEE